MYIPASLDRVNKKKNAAVFLKNAVYRMGGTVEILAVLAVWILIFSKRAVLGGLTREEILTYILVGNLIGAATNHLLRRIVVHDISRDNLSLLMNSPASYLAKIIIRGFGRNILPFILSVAFQIFLFYFFIDDFKINSDPYYLSVIAIMLVLAFLSELLILYFLHFFVFWSVESAETYNFILRLKSILAGSYFPLVIWPAIVNISLVMPFAYSCFVPAELYLKKTGLETGLRGICVQMIWIMVLYIILKIVWTRKTHRQNIRPKEISIE
ncbi:MAG: ABC-2 family transporter protein [Candidatus Falkowbacteria bacterium]